MIPKASEHWGEIRGGVTTKWQGVSSIWGDENVKNMMVLITLNHLKKVIGHNQTWKNGD